MISGQIGKGLDGHVPSGLAEQMELAWDNITAILIEAGMSISDLVKISVFVTVPGSVGLYRTIRDRRLGGHLCAATYLEVSALAAPGLLFEIEGEAVCEEPDEAFLELPQEDDVFSGRTTGSAPARAEPR